jgi:hypothetical protein
MAACKGVIVNVYVAAQKPEGVLNSHKCARFRSQRFYLGKRARVAMQHREARKAFSMGARA